MTDTAQVVAPTTRPGRNRAGTEERLIVAAAELLAEIGPRTVSVRAIAERAGVNHGLVHHYFGGKEALLRAGMARLVGDHAERVRAGAHGGPMPAALGLVDDPAYLRAVVRAVLDDEMDLARTELDLGVSVPRAALDHVTAARGLSEPDVETKAYFGLAMALEMGWAALEPFIHEVTGTNSESEKDELRRAARAVQRDLQRTWSGKVQERA